uniref:Uncharacterized protein n=1 Tax=Theropithecus gelada TaxID=9565 RepID=A0A8D2FP44_THEGE
QKEGPGLGRGEPARPGRGPGEGHECHDVPHHHSHQGGPRKVQDPESDCEDRQWL